MTTLKKFYRIQPRDSSQFIAPVRSQDGDVLWAWARGEASESSVSTIEMVLQRTTERGVPLLRASMPWIGFGLLCFERNLFLSIQDEAERWGSRAELECPDGDFIALRPPALSALLDRERTEFGYLHNGDIAEIKRAYFNDDAPIDSPFRVAEYDNGALFASHSIAEFLCSRSVGGPVFTDATERRRLF